jgi:regulator of protease activity HflC (stomatin/prohibitin superfamily)
MSWILSLAGGASDMYGQHEGERDSKRATMFNVAQYERNAGQVQAASQRSSEEQRRQARFLESRALALAGGGASDVSVVDTIGDIAAEGEYRALSALYEGDATAQNLRARAKAKVFEGDQFQKASQYATAGTIFKSGSSLYSKYGGKGSTSDLSDRSLFRDDDPYKDRNYVGGGEGE